MINNNPEQLKRNVQLDSDNQLQQLKSLNARARIDGGSVYLEVLADRLLWNSSSIAVQDLAIEEVKRRLTDAYKFVEAKDYSCGGEAHRIATFEHLATGLKLNLIPGGQYRRGSTSRLTFDRDRSLPKVTIPALLVGQTKVTQKAWDKIGGEDERNFKGADLPIDSCSWIDCDNWLGKVGDGLRMLSEDEWEYACSAGMTTEYFFGDNESDLGDYGWFKDNSDKKTHPVGQKKPNAFGLYDMHGNVWEWCADWYTDDYSLISNNHEPYDSPDFGRVLRGGAWHSPAWRCRSMDRRRDNPSNRSDYLGLRVARSIN